MNYMENRIAYSNSTSTCISCHKSWIVSPWIILLPITNRNYINHFFDHIISFHHSTGTLSYWDYSFMIKIIPIIWNIPYHMISYPFHILSNWNNHHCHCYINIYLFLILRSIKQLAYLYYKITIIIHCNFQKNTEIK